MKHYKGHTTYFLTEGKTNLQDCVRLSFRQAVRSGISQIVMFTANGDGVELACEKYLNTDDYRSIQVLAVSFPHGRVSPEATRISESRMALFAKFQIRIIRAANPLDELIIPNRPGRDLVRRSLELFSGGMALCLRAAIIACDSGAVTPGGHVISMSADTSIVVKAAPSSHLFSTVAIREIICMPVIKDITKGEILAAEINVDSILLRRSGARRLSQGKGISPTPDVTENKKG